MLSERAVVSIQQVDDRRFVADMLSALLGAWAPNHDDNRIVRRIGSKMSTRPAEPALPGDHLELSTEEQLVRAVRWDPSTEPVLNDLSDEEEAAFLDAISH